MANLLSEGDLILKKVHDYFSPEGGAVTIFTCVRRHTCPTFKSLLPSTILAREYLGIGVENPMVRVGYPTEGIWALSWMLELPYEGQFPEV